MLSAAWCCRDPAEVEPWAETCGLIRPLNEEHDGAVAEVRHVAIDHAKLHYHEKTDEICHIIEGTGSMVPDDEEIELHEGVVVYVPRGVKHKAIGRLTVLKVWIPRASCTTFTSWSDEAWPAHALAGQWMSLHPVALRLSQ